MAKLNWRRVGRGALVALLAMTVAMTAASCELVGGGQHRAIYCAIMPDSVGLYAGNPVTQMGYQIGTIENITPNLRDVRVEFAVTVDRRLPSDVKAMTRSTSLLADRTLELIGNEHGGPQLQAGECIPLSQSFTPKSLSEMIGSASEFVDSINPDGSRNIGEVVSGLDQVIQNNGAGINRLLTTTSSVLDSPDQVINDIGTATTNLAQLSSLIREQSGPLKAILLDAQKILPDVYNAVHGSSGVLSSTAVLLKAVADIEVNAGDSIQFTLDATSMALRKAGAHAPAIADLLTPVPWWINTVANHYNNRPWNMLQYRPPLYRIRTPDGVALCNILNATAPGTCANVQGQPYAVDVALLQYVLTEASR